MSRIDEINNILFFYRDLYKSNENLPISKDTFLYNFKQYGYDAKDLYEKGKNIKIDNLFNNWINRYKKKNISVFIDDRQPNYIQFYNTKEDNDNESRSYKLYLSYGKNDIDEAVIKIFDYIDLNDIDSNSKVSTKVSSDDIILRIRRKEDALKLINFINQDQFLQQKAHKTNPFIKRNGVVGYAYDGLMNFDNNISVLLESYFLSARRNNTLDKTSYDDFKEYVTLYINNLYNNSLFAKTVADYKNIFYKSNGDTKKLVNYYETLLVIKNVSLNNTSSLDEYLNLVESFKDFKFEDQIYERFDELVNTKNADKRDLLDSYIRYGNKIYGFDKRKNCTYKYLEAYVKNGKSINITKDHNYRSLFDELLSPSKILEIAENNIENYCKYVFIVDTFKNTYEKYDDEHLARALESAFKNGSYKFFSNGGDNFYRETLTSHFTKNDLALACERLIKEHNLDRTLGVYGAINLAIKSELNKDNK